MGWTVFKLLLASIGVVRATRLVDDANAHREHRVVVSPNIENQYWRAASSRYELYPLQTLQGNHLAGAREEARGQPLDSPHCRRPVGVAHPTLELGTAHVSSFSRLRGLILQ